MLVLSRKVGQEIRLVEAGVTIRVGSSSPSKVQLSIDAPRELTILRGELERDEQSTLSSRSASSAVQRLAEWAESLDASQLADEMPLVDELLERLLELRLTAAQQRDEKPAAIVFDDLAPPSLVRQSSAAYAVAGCC